MLQIETIERMAPGHLVQHYLLASYCYYHLSLSPMTDAAFDRLCVRLRAVLPTLTHQHKSIINPDDLDAGSCFLDESQFPRIVAHGAYMYSGLCMSNRMATLMEPHLLPVAQATRRISRRPSAAQEPPAAAPRRVRRTVVPVATAPPIEVKLPNDASTPRRIVRRPTR